MQINQFHSGTAPADAITNEMLAIREMLLAAGYASVIYAEHIAPELAELIRPIAEYDGRSDNVLLVHHSMGFDCFDRIAGLPDHKILIYHNITPPQFFDDVPSLVPYVEKGKAQLLKYREHVEFAFANSEFTREELSRLGFTRTGVLPVTFGLEALLRTPPSAEVSKRLAGTVNLLFVGRIVPNKKQDDLVRMFAYYRRHIDASARLRLIGKYEGDSYYATLRRECAASGLDGSVVMPGQVTDAELVAYYRSASVYVSVSEHEGFGVPLAESMAFNVPIIAFAAGAVPFTLGQAGMLVQRKDPVLLAELVAEVVQNDGLRADILAAQADRLEELRPRPFLDKLIRIVGETSSPGKRASQASDLRRVQIQGPLETSYSLAIVNRGLARALARIPSVDVSLYATEGPGDYMPRPEDLADKPDIEALWQKSRGGPEPDVVIRNMYPPRVEDVNPHQINAVYFYWEDSLMPAAWAENFNRHLDLLLAPTRHVRTVLRRSGVAIPIAIVGAGVDAPRELDTACVAPAPFRTDKSFRFLHISSGFPRKGCDVLLRAYTAEFSAADDVTLIIKTFPNPHNMVARQIEEARHAAPDAPEIVHLDCDLSPAGMAALYREASCLVHPARAEGFGLPVAEAMLQRIPVIATNYSGLADLCSDTSALLLDYELQPSASHFEVDGAQWAEPDVRQLRRHMRYSTEHAASADTIDRVNTAQGAMRRNFTWDEVACRTVAAIDSIEHARTASRVGLVTTWGIKCGIAEYARHLVEASRHDGVQWTILAADDGAPLEPDTSNVVRCWQDRWHGDLSRVLDEVERRDLDIVHFEFNFGFFELADFGRAIRTLRQEHNRAVFVTLHASKDAMISDQPVSLSSIAADLQLADRIFVHSAEDTRRLADWGLQENVTRLPHAFLSFPEQDRHELRRSLGITASPVIATFGFALPHKGLLQTIEALSLLRDAYPGMLLLALTSLHPDARSPRYYERCRERIGELGLDRNCLIVTEFLRPDQIITGLQAADVVVLPYHESNESSSAAVRLPLASHRPVVTTRQPIFADVADIVHQIEAPSPPAIAHAIHELLTEPALGKDIVRRADARVSRDSWSSIAHIQVKAMRAATVPSLSSDRPCPGAATG